MIPRTTTATPFLGDLTSGPIERDLGALFYLMLPLLFYLLMRGRRRRPSVLLSSSRHRSQGRRRVSRNGY